MALLLASCAAPRGLVFLERPPLTPWVDDASGESLETAIAQSIDYYRKLPPTASFLYGELSYSPTEMISSLELFLHLWRENQGPEDFTRKLGERFHFFESIALTRDNLFTGYYEPLIRGSTTPSGDLVTPLYGRPGNLVEIDLSRFSPSLPHRKLMGRLEDGQVVPYFSRREIHEGALQEGSAELLAYVNEVDLFFLQIQGSGAVQFPDGRRLRVGYVASNGHAYRSIGAELVRREVFTLEEVTMQSIREYLAREPEAVRSLLDTNPSYVFFQAREDGPLGNLNFPLTPGRSLAMDFRLFPKGGLAYLQAEQAVFGDSVATRPLQRFMVVQDTGGAIRGHGRADVFWGKGPEAEWAAGHMRYPGRVFLLVAKKEFLPAATGE